MKKIYRALSGRIRHALIFPAEAIQNYHMRFGDNDLSNIPRYDGLKDVDNAFTNENLRLREMSFYMKNLQVTAEGFKFLWDLEQRTIGNMPDVDPGTVEHRAQIDAISEKICKMLNNLWQFLQSDEFKRPQHMESYVVRGELLKQLQKTFSSRWGVDKLQKSFAKVEAELNDQIDQSNAKYRNIMSGTFDLGDDERRIESRIALLQNFIKQASEKHVTKVKGARDRRDDLATFVEATTVNGGNQSDPDELRERMQGLDEEIRFQQEEERRLELARKPKSFSPVGKARSTAAVITSVLVPRGQSGPDGVSIPPQQRRMSDGAVHVGNKREKMAVESTIVVETASSSEKTYLLPSESDGKSNGSSHGCCGCVIL